MSYYRGECKCPICGRTVSAGTDGKPFPAHRRSCEWLRDVAAGECAVPIIPRVNS